MKSPEVGEPSPAEVRNFVASRERVLGQIADACARVGRDLADVTLVAVSKTVPPARLVAAVAAGLRLFGENRVQEGETKAALVRGATWHLVGPLQSNKVRRALATFDTIETLDTLELAERVDRLAAETRPPRRVPVLLEVNVDDDPSKAGFSPAGLERDLTRIVALPNLEVRGLMTVGRYVDRAEAARPTFVALRRLSEELRSRDAGLGPELSMGMSDDFPVAVEEGATIVRVGRALFGERPRGL